MAFQVPCPSNDCKLTLKTLVPYLDEITAIGGIKLAGWFAMDDQWSAIKLGPGDEGDHVLELLHRWLEGKETKDVPHTVEFFTEMLRSCGKKDLAHRIQHEMPNICDPCVDRREQIGFNLQKLMPFIDSRLASKGPKLAAWLDMYAAWNSMSRDQSLTKLEDRLQELLHQWSNDTEGDVAPHTMNFFISVVHQCGLNKLADEMEKEFGIACAESEKLENDSSDTVGPDVGRMRLDDELDVKFAIVTTNNIEWDAAMYFMKHPNFSQKINSRYIHQYTDDSTLEQCALIANPRCRYDVVEVNTVRGVFFNCPSSGPSDIIERRAEDFFGEVSEKEWPLTAIFIIGYCEIDTVEGKNAPEGTLLMAKNFLKYDKGEVERGPDVKFSSPWMTSIENCRSRGDYSLSQGFQDVQFCLDYPKDSVQASCINIPCKTKTGIGVVDRGGASVLKAVKSYPHFRRRKAPDVIFLKVVCREDKQMHKDFSFFSEIIGEEIDHNTCQQMCTIMSLTLALRAIATSWPMGTD